MTEPLRAQIVCTTNYYDEESLVTSIVTLFRIAVRCGEQSWEIQRRYSEFLELNEKLSLRMSTNCPTLPPKLLRNQVRNPHPTSVPSRRSHRTCACIRIAA